jgi:hypothetical protein
MPILKTFRAPNGITVSYCRLGNVEGRFPDLVVQVQCWVDEAAYLQGTPPAYAHYVPFTATALRDELEHAALALPDLTGGTLLAEGDSALDGAKVRRWAALKAQRDELDSAPFEHAGFLVEADHLSSVRIMRAIMAMQLSGQTSRLWRCADNVMRELSLAELISISTGIDARRQQLIETSDALWQQIQGAQEGADVAAVSWPS